jgi:hypothetical protein
MPATLTGTSEEYATPMENLGQPAFDARTKIKMAIPAFVWITYKT